MKINQSPLDAANLSQSSRAQEATGGGAGGLGKSASWRGPDRVQVSDLSSQLLTLGDASGPDRAARVQQLTAAVRSGQYQVDAADLSHRMVEEAIRQ